jgi:hypothetical protein
VADSVPLSSLSLSLSLSPPPSLSSPLSVGLHLSLYLYRILEACAVKMFRSSLGPNQSDASLCMKKYDHASKPMLAQFLKQYGA